MNRKRIFVVCALLLWAVQGVTAQEVPTTSEQSPATVQASAGQEPDAAQEVRIVLTNRVAGNVTFPPTRRDLRRAQFDFDHPHELRVTFGAYSHPGYFTVGCDCWNMGYTPMHDFIDSHYYEGPEIYTGSYSVGYTYRFTRVIAFGATLTYAGRLQNVYHNADGSLFLRERWHYFSILPTLRVNWFNSRMVSLYSSLGLGVTFASERMFDNKGHHHDSRGIRFAGQFVPLGLKVGRRFYGFAEFGCYGAQGLLTAGFGYNF